MATIRVLLGIICLTALSGHRLSGEHYLIKSGNSYHASSTQPALQELELLDCARKEVGVKEQNGQNDGPAVERYLSYVGLKKGEPWCAAFVSWVFGQAGFSQPRTAWSPALFPPDKLQQKPASGLVFGIYFPEFRRIAHCGFVERVAGSWLVTIEGNTNIAGGRNGDGVYRKWRHQKTIYAYARWVAKRKGAGNAH